MNETVNQIPENTTAEPMEATQAVETTPDPDDWSDLENFDDIEVMDSDEEGTDEQPAEPEADQQTEAAETETPDTEEPESATEQETAGQPELIELKHLGQVVRVTPEQLNAYAQMGLDYQRIRGDRDAARAEVARLKEMEDYLKELAAPQGISVEDLLDGAKAEVLANKEHLDRGIALQRVKLDRERKQFEAQKAQQTRAQQEQSEKEQRQRDQFLQFAKEYPKVKPNDIPKEVWEKFKDGMNLTSAYAQYEAKSLRDQVASLEAKLEAEKKNSENKKRSTGTQKSAGNVTEQDAFDRLWYDGT